MSFTIRYMLLLVLVFSIASAVLAENNPDESQRYYQPLDREAFDKAGKGLDYSPQYKPLNQEAIEEASHGLNYTPKEGDKVIEKQKPQKNLSLPSFSALGGIVKILIYISGAIIIGFLVYYILLFFIRQNNVKVDLKDEIKIENLEEYIHETDLEKFLKEALNSGQYAAAIRVYYLMIIKHLSEKNAIQWKREKTNKDYMRELENKPWSSEFNELTYFYEKIWYGDIAPSESLFLSLETRFKSFLQQLISGKA